MKGLELVNKCIGIEIQLNWKNKEKIKVNRMNIEFNRLKIMK